MSISAELSTAVMRHKENLLLICLHSRWALKYPELVFYVWGNEGMERRTKKNPLNLPSRSRQESSPG